MYIVSHIFCLYLITIQFILMSLLDDISIKLLPEDNGKNSAGSLKNKWFRPGLL